MLFAIYNPMNGRFHRRWVPNVELAMLNIKAWTLAGFVVEW